MDKEAAPPPHLDWSDLLHRFIDLLLPTANDIFSSPSKLGELLSICAALAVIEPKARGIATALALQDKEILGWTLVRREGSRYVENSRVQELLLSCPAAQIPALLKAVGKILGNIGETKWQTLCAASGRVDTGEAIYQCGTTVFLRSNPKS
jgi:hypothetical protein